MSIIQTKQLSKRYGSLKAVDEVSIQVRQGEIYGLLGLNGAGKTTLIRMLLGMIKPDDGEVLLFGNRLNKDFNRWNDLGYLVETPHSYPNLSVLDNLRVFYKLRDLKNPALIDEILTRLKLEKYRHIKAGNLSMGNQQRLGLAKALMHHPALLILDEPINGLDPEGIVEVRELLKDLCSNGSTILLSSHILGEISKVANRIGIIHEGKLVKEIHSNELKDQLLKKLIIETTDNASAIQTLHESGISAILSTSNSLEIKNKEAIQHPEIISQILVEKGYGLRQIMTYTEDLEMYFLRTINTSKNGHT